MPPPSLRQLCTATAIRNVKYLNDIGNIPYILARPFLIKIESPEKLRSIETQSSHIIDEDGELWFEFIKRDIPNWDQYELPGLSNCSYEVYCDLRERVQKSVDEDAERMKMALDGINSERAKHSAKFVDRKHLRLPQERPTTKQRYASFDRKMGGIRPVFASSRTPLGSSDPLGTPLWSFERPPLPRPETKKKSSIFASAKRNAILTVPTKQLNNRASQVKQAPRSLIEEHRRPVEPTAPRRKDYSTPALRAPGRSNPHEIGVVNYVATPALQEKERRLRAITSGQRLAAHSSTSPALSRAETDASSTSPCSANDTRATLIRGSGPNMEAKSLAREQTSYSDAYKSIGLGAGSFPGQSRTSPEQGPRTATIRKRPPPNPLIQPKRKRVS